MTPLRAPADLALAKRCCAGEHLAQRELFQREKRRVHATLYRVLGSNAEMDDLVQDAFLEIFRALRSFRGEATLGTWIDRVTVRVAYGHIAKRKATAVSLSLVPDAPSGAPGADERTASREAMRRLYAVLDHVEARQRIAWVLHHLEGRSIADVAAVMEATSVLTKVRVWRAQRAIETHARRDPLLCDFVTAVPATESGG